MVRGEMMQRHDEYVIPATVRNGLLATTGYYGEAVFVVTGEDRIPNARLRMSLSGRQDRRLEYR